MLNKQIAVLTIRVLLGLIFFFQASYSELLPDFILLFSAYFTSLTELIAGFMLIIGFKRDYALYALALVLVIVTFGHGLKDPIWDLSHVMYRTILLVSLLLLPKELDKFSVDFLIKKDK